jgi:hypothetical protein
MEVNRQIFEDIKRILTEKLDWSRELNSGFEMNKEI